MRVVDFSHADETAIATGLVAPTILAAGHFVDSGVGPRSLDPTGAGGSDVHTRRRIRCQVVADESVGAPRGSVDVGQCDLCGGR